MAEHSQDESKRVAQHKLAAEFTELVHGLGAAEECVKQHRALHKPNMSLEDVIALAKIQSSEAETTVEGHPSVTKNAKPQSIDKYSTVQAELPRGAVIGKPISHVLWSAGLSTTKSEAQKLINNKGAYIGAQSTAKGAMTDSLTYSPIQMSGWDWWKEFIIDDHLLILRTGKWRVKIVTIIPDEDFEAKGLTCPGYEYSSQAQVEPFQSAQDGPEAQNDHTAKQSVPHIRPEGDVLDNGGWDQITRLRMGKDTKRLLAREETDQRRRSDDEGASELNYRPSGGGFGGSSTYPRGRDQRMGLKPTSRFGRGRS